MCVQRLRQALSSSLYHPPMGSLACMHAARGHVLVHVMDVSLEVLLRAVRYPVSSGQPGCDQAA